LQAVANLTRTATPPSTRDDELRKGILASMETQPWCPMGLNVLVRDGVADLSGIITDDRQRSAAVVAAKNVAGVKAVHDHLCWVDTMTGTYIDPPAEEAKVS
jgi:osmotically-inducible protein OsmY